MKIEIKTDANVVKGGLPEQGWHIANIVEATFSMSKSTNKPMVTYTYEIIGNDPCAGKTVMYNNLVLSPGKPLPNGKRSMGGVDIFISLLQSMGSEGAIDPSDEKDLFDKFCNKPFMAKIVHKESQNLDGSERTNANIVASRLLHAEEIVALSSLYGKALVPGSGNKPLKNDAEFDFESEEDDIPF